MPLVGTCVGMEVAFGERNEVSRILVGSSNPDNVYDALTVLDENAEKMFRRMNTCVKRGVGRNPSTVFYDVTNFFFEIGAPRGVQGHGGAVKEPQALPLDPADFPA